MKRTQLKRKAGLKVRSPLKRGNATEKKRPRDTGPSKKIRDLVKRRADYKCERCGLCPGQVIHHRDPRGNGGSSRPEVNLPSNLVYICEPCHLRVESRRLEAIGGGWLVPDGYAPADVPVRLYYGRHLLTDDGGVIPLPGRCRAGCAVWKSEDQCDCAKEAL